MWIWIAIGVGSFALVSLTVGLAFARIVRAISAASEVIYESDMSGVARRSF